MTYRAVIITLCLLACSPGAWATDPIAVLETHCLRCHSSEKPKGELDLSTRDSALRGGDTGPAFTPGKPDDSLLIRSVRHQTDSPMPHKERKLPDESIAALASWVQSGAPYPHPLKAATQPAGEFKLTDADRAHWAFQAIRRPDVPSSAGPTPIDRFILSRLQPLGLTLSPPADKRTLIRRVTLDLIGLPPTPEEVDAFLADTSPDAYEKLIDRLLASPHYGERWARHWLDVARFAETDGFEHDQTRPNSWRYRDYVINSLNADKPHDRFIREQIAGDELYPGDPDAITATGFNLLGPDMVDSSDQIQRRHNTLNDMTDTTAFAFLGLTLACARCHDHKFEPLSQRDYYSLQAFFTPAKFVSAQPIPTPEQRAAHDAAVARFNADPQVGQLVALEAPVREKLRQKKLAKLSPEARAAHQTPPDQRTSEQANLVLETEDQLHVTDKEVAAAIPASDKSRYAELLAAAKHIARPPELPAAMALTDGKPAKTFILHRGEYSQPLDEVTPAFPQVLTPTIKPEAEGAADAPDRLARRTDLANWIASPNNPLTARVIVNRVWQHHFGRGLVPTPSDFGTHGQPPSHPKLLDYLAADFIAHNWSLKHLHKQILLSATYQQSSRTRMPESARTADPDNHLLWRMNRLRLEGEVIRDSLLAVSGQLNLKVGGPSVFPPLPEEVFKGSKGGWTTSKDPADSNRRSLYIFARRNLRFPLLEVFDAPDSNLSCPAREKSTSAPQSLALLNDDQVLAAARALADRLANEPPDQQVTIAYRLTLGRPPTNDELNLSRDFLKQSPLPEFCRALFNLNEFVYAE